MKKHSSLIVPERNEKVKNTGLKVSLCVFWFIIFVLLFSKSMFRAFDHDENLYVSGAVLLAKGYVPYHDFPYGHFPNQMLIYAPFMKLFSHKLFIVRFLNVILGWLTLFVIFLFAKEQFEKALGKTKAIWLAICSVLIIVFNPLFIYTSGLAWNHDLSTLTAVLAFYFLVKTIEKPQNKFAFLTGFFLSFSACTRISFAPLFFPTRWALGKYGGQEGLKKRILWFYGGLILAGLPTIILFLIGPKEFVFKTFLAASFHTHFMKTIGYKRAMSIGSKISCFLKDIILAIKPNFILIVSIGIFMVWLNKHLLSNSLLKTCFLYLLFLFPGTFAPTPSWQQYFYPLIVFSLCLLVSLASVTRHKHQCWQLIPFLLILSLSIPYIKAYTVTTKIWQFSKYVPERCHHLGENLTKICGQNSLVLTLCPIYPLEAGLNIYLEFADGPFAWRNSFFIKGYPSKQFKIVSPYNLQDFLEKKPPDCILVGCEPFWIEKPFFIWAKKHKYLLFKIDEKICLKK